MRESSSSGGKKARLPDLRFPILEPATPREIRAGPGAALRVIALSEAFLPIAAAVQGSEARRLALKTDVPFHLLD